MQSISKKCRREPNRVLVTDVNEVFIILTSYERVIDICHQRLGLALFYILLRWTA